ncbi:MAG TPA: transposase [Thermoguttaceae bacterium]|nr:transposase [Thermoguttaceae bacterium]
MPVFTRVLTCAENDQVVMVSLLFGMAPPTLGAAEDLEYLVARLRAVWPGVRITIRADSGFAVPRFYEACERVTRLDYTIGLKMNAVLRRRSDALLAEAVARFEQTGQSRRLFDAFWYRAGSWPASRAPGLSCTTTGPSPPPSTPPLLLRPSTPAKDRARNNCRDMAVGHVCSVPGTMESCPTYCFCDP